MQVHERHSTVDRTPERMKPSLVSFVALFPLLSCFFLPSSSVSSSVYLEVKSLLPDGEVQLLVHHKGIRARSTADGHGLEVGEVSKGPTVIRAIFYEGNMTDCEVIKNGEESRRFREDWEESRNASATASLTHRFTGKSQLDRSLRRLLRVRGLAKECSLLHGNILEKYLDGGDERRRRKRETLELTRVPGTVWCGKGNRARDANHIGGTPDVCCRTHDACPYSVLSFDTEYGLYNFRPYTISHCDCDERFRTCLKMIGSETANLIGKLYFNTLEMRCFKFRVEMQCSKRSWWGKCLEEKKQKVAFWDNSATY
ncbi:unnamed protein product [Darwinula stevensoni]|uniref:Phospholipase A2-like central domain-containing protein n=1 Tax=Darwinula stevensoni TaxID=69355 RepID=A0A7R9A6M2_9CRUS|nr:unnamed protein product [Darwinula stevensoni]CAG0889705.1 unnamed protein product [Darwinula stevensoni]